MTTTQETPTRPSCHPRRFQRGCRNCQKYERRHSTTPARRPAAPLTEYVRTDLINGQRMTLYRIAQRSGIAYSAVTSIANGERTWVYPHVDDAIRGVAPLPPSPTNTTTAPVVISRIVDVLAQECWSLNHIGERLGVTRQAIRSWQKWNPTLATVNRLVEFYREVEGTPGPCPESARRLRRRTNQPVPRVGWYGTDITDPDVDPHEPVPTFVGRRMLRALAAMGWFPANIQNRYPAADTVFLDEVMRSTDDRHRTIPRWVNNLIHHAFDTLSDIPGPDMDLAEQVRTWGWRTAAWWDGRDITDQYGRQTTPPPGPVCLCGDPEADHFHRVPRGCSRDRGFDPAPEKSGWCVCGNPAADHQPPAGGCSTYTPEHRYSLVNVHNALAGCFRRHQLTDLETADVVWRLRGLEYTDQQIVEFLRWGGKDPVVALKQHMDRIRDKDPRVLAVIPTRPVAGFVAPRSARTQVAA